MKFEISAPGMIGYDVTCLQIPSYHYVKDGTINVGAMRSLSPVKRKWNRVMGFWKKSEMRQ